MRAAILVVLLAAAVALLRLAIVDPSHSSLWEGGGAALPDMRGKNIVVSGRDGREGR